MEIIPPRVENKVIHHEQRKAKWGACGKKKKKKGCWYGCGCYRVPTQIKVTGCPATRVLRNLKERTKATLMCLVSLSWKQPTVPAYSSTFKPSKQPLASSDSHRNQAVQDCISYINATTTSSSSSSSTVMARSPPPTSSVAQTPPSTIVTVTIPPPPPPPPPHFSPISTAQNKSTSVIPSTCP